jgi:hypothetical protein
VSRAARDDGGVIVAVRAPLLVAGLIGLVTACSSGDGTDLDARTPPSTSTAPPTVETAQPAPIRPDDTSPDDTSPDDTLDTSIGATSASADATSPASTERAVAETGVPGLDADDAFCAAWSRFGGSFQVIAVNAAFGDAPSETLETAASPTVTAAYVALGEHWPDEIADEREAALEGALGPFARRLAAASEALGGSGATDADLDALDTAWVGALAERDPEDPVLQLDLAPGLRTLVDAAAATYLEQVGAWAADESLVNDVEIPATNQYLADNCPDQGTLAGQEVGG